MFSTLHHQNCVTPRLRWAILLWMVVCQFPIPMAHSHENHDAQNAWSLAKHVYKHHADQPLAPNAVHWHFVIPWELACGLGDEADAIAPPLACSCSPDAQSQLLVDISDVTGLAAPDLDRRMLESPLEPTCIPRSTIGSTHGFLQTYLSVRSSQITCVFLS